MIIMTKTIWTRVDFTAVCIIDGFKNETASRSMERLLKRVSEEKAKELCKVPHPLVAEV